MAKGPTKAELIERLQALESQYLPRHVETLSNAATEPPSLLAGITADRMHAAIQAAEHGEPRDLFTIYRDVLMADSHLAGEIEKRFMAILGEDPDIQPKDPDKPDDVAAAELIKEAIDEIDFTKVCKSLLWGNLWPVSVMERTYKRAARGRWQWNEFIRVPDHLLTWRDRGQMQIQLCDPSTSQPNGQFVLPEPTRYLIHRGHLMETADSWGGPMRTLIWWSFLKLMNREWWVRFLDKFGTPFTVARFDKNDDRSRQILERAFRMSTRVGGLVVTKDTQVELVQAQSQGNTDAFAKFYELCNDEISKRVVGQVLSSNSKPGGLGNGNAELQGQVRSDIGQFDKRMLAQTLRLQLFKPLLRLNGLSGAPPMIIWGGEDEDDNVQTADAISKLGTAGIELADDALPVLSRRMSLRLQRKAPQPGPTPIPKRTQKTLSSPASAGNATAAADSISREAAAMLLQVFRGSLAPARDVILASSSPDDASERLTALFTDWSPTQVAEVVESAVNAGAFNALDGTDQT